MTLGQHPYGRDAPEQVQRIRVGSPPQLGALTRKNTTAAIEAADLIAGLLQRPNAQLSVGSRVRRGLAHPLFWTVQEKFQLISSVSEGLEVNQHLVPNVHQRIFATDIQSTFIGYLNGDTTWAAHMTPPAAMGPDGWDNSRLWPFKSPALYEATYAGPFNMYSLVRFVRNLYVHGASHVRVGVFASTADITAHVLTCFPWLPLALWQVDARHGGHFTSEISSDAVSDGSDRWGTAGPGVRVSPSPEDGDEGTDSDASTTSETPLVMVSHKRLLPDGSVAAVMPPKHGQAPSPAPASAAAAAAQHQPSPPGLALLGAPLSAVLAHGTRSQSSDSSDSDSDGLSTRFFLPSALQRQARPGRRHSSKTASRRRKGTAVSAQAIIASHRGRRRRRTASI